MPRAKVILPKKLILDAKAMGRVIENTLNATAKDMKIDFDVTAQTWKNKPQFVIETPSPYERIVATGSIIYSYVNDGTPPHVITPHRSKLLRFSPFYRAKTSPRSISSGPGGSSGDAVFARRVNHPGTKAREFDRVIAEKWDRLLPGIFQRAVDSAI